MNKISESELEVMKIIWNKKEVTSLEIIQELSAQSSWSKNTIKTLLARLVDKGFVRVIKNKGSLYLYEPLTLEEDYQKEENQNFVNRLYNGSVDKMLLTFVKSNSLSKKELKKLMDLIENEGE